MNPTNAQTTRAQLLFRLLLGVAMLGAGVSHLTFLRAEFQAQVPNWIPIDEDLVVVLSGGVEIVLGLAMLILGRHQTWVGIALAVFLFLIFPGNISQYVNEIDAFGLDTDRKRFARLFFQPVLILWALWSTGYLRRIIKR